MAEYGLVESFKIDNGELDGLRQQECFVLGVEWANVYAIVQSDGIATGSVLIHHANASRLLSMCEKHGRFCEYVKDTQEWGRLIIGGKK